MKYVSLGIDCAMASALKLHLHKPDAYDYPFYGVWIYNDKYPNTLSLSVIADLFETRFEGWDKKEKGFRGKYVSTKYPIEFTHGTVLFKKVKNLLKILDDGYDIIFCQMFRLYSFNDEKINETISGFNDSIVKFRSVMLSCYPNVNYRIKMYDLVKNDKQKEILTDLVYNLDIDIGFPKYGRFVLDNGKISTSFYGTNWENAFKESGCIA